MKNVTWSSSLELVISSGGQYQYTGIQLDKFFADAFDGNNTIHELGVILNGLHQEDQGSVTYTLARVVTAANMFRDQYVIDNYTITHDGNSVKLSINANLEDEIAGVISRLTFSTTTLLECRFITHILSHYKHTGYNNLVTTVKL